MGAHNVAVVSRRPMGENPIKAEPTKKKSFVEEAVLRTSK
jgi:hypothetical protein